MPDQRSASNLYLPCTESDATALIQLAALLNEQNLSQPLIATKIASPLRNGGGRSNDNHDHAYLLLPSERHWRVVPIAGPGNVPCVVKPVVDERTMTEMAIIENAQRENLSVADEARAYEQLSTKFGLTDEQIGQRVGKDRSTICNLRNLLALPPDVLNLVGEGDGKIPQRVARKLVKLARIAPQAVSDTAQQLLKNPDESDALVQHAIQQYTHPIEHEWDLKWPKQPIGATDKDGLFDVGACDGCPAFLKIGKTPCCTNQRCYAAKTRLYVGGELARVSQATGVPIAADDERVTVLDINYRNKARAGVWLKAKTTPNHLRLIARLDKQFSSWWHHRDLLGTGEVLLASTNPKALNQRESVEKPVESTAKAPMPRAGRIEGERLAHILRREEQALARKARADVTWLVINTARILAPKMVISGGVLAFSAEFIDRHSPAPSDNWPEMQEFMITHRKAQSVVKDTRMDLEPILRERILLDRLINALQSLAPYEMFDWPCALRQVEQLAGQFGLKLSSGWDRPPVHQTVANCWHCGRFASLNRLTDRDREEGWGVIQRGQDVVDVHCPDCGGKPTHKKTCRNNGHDA